MVGVNLYDARRELLRTPGEHEWCGGSATNASHDPNGNMTTATMPTAVAWTFSYDAENRMLSASASGGAGGSYSYDILDHRSAKLVSAVYTMFLGDAQDEEIAEYKHQSDGGSPDWTPVLLRRFVPGPGVDQPIAMVDVTSGSAVRTYFHVNRLGSVIAMSGDTSAKTEGPYTYDAYGNLCGASGAPGCAVPGGEPFKFTGRRFDPETGLYYYRARYYSPQLGRFMQTDPIGYKQDLNLYAYVRNDPIDGVDPTGLVINFVAASGASEEDVNSAREKFNKALDYIGSRSATGKADIQYIRGSTTVVNVVVDPHTENHTYGVTDANGNASIRVTWNPRQQLETQEHKVQSAALGLGHELSGHAKRMIENRAQYDADMKQRRASDRITWNEVKATNASNAIARELGEPTQKSWLDRSENPTPTTDDVLAHSPP